VQNESGVLTTVLLSSWGIGLLVWFLSRPLARWRFDRWLAAMPKLLDACAADPDPLRALARLDVTPSPAGAVQRRIERWQTAALALPMVGCSLAAPLTLHFLFVLACDAIGRVGVVARTGRRRNRQQRIGDAAHRRDDNDRPLGITRAGSADDLDQAANSSRIGDRCAAKFLNDHERRSILTQVGPNSSFVFGLSSLVWSLVSPSLRRAMTKDRRPKTRDDWCVCLETHVRERRWRRDRNVEHSPVRVGDLRGSGGGSRPSADDDGVRCGPGGRRRAN